jgi:hypothetical protein
MSHKKKHTPRVPPGNRSQVGPPDAAVPADQNQQAGSAGAPMQEQDAKRRLGDFEGAGEHSLQQPGGRQGANRHGSG